VTPRAEQPPRHKAISVHGLPHKHLHVVALARGKREMFRPGSNKGHTSFQGTESERGRNSAAKNLTVDRIFHRSPRPPAPGERLLRLTPAQGRPAVLKQSQVDQLFLYLVVPAHVQGLANLGKQKLSQFLAS